MGYTNYYEVHGWTTPEWQAAWSQLINDVPLILAASDVLVSGPSDTHDLTPPLIDLHEGICFNGVADDSHEPFNLGPDCQDFFVKTLSKPYDTPVACVLLRAYFLAPDNIQVFSDGRWKDIEWVNARQLYQELWPDDPCYCPWNEDYGEQESDAEDENHEGNEDEQAASEVVIEDKAPSDEEPINDTMETTEMLKRLKLNSSLSQQQSIKSTVAEIDFTHVRKWLSQCDRDKSHGECKPTDIQWEDLPGVQFKVIDLERRCVVDAPANCSFVILTYVWGKIDQPMLRKGTKSLLMREGGLDAMWPHIPCTIRDAITVCQMIGERYLWIDALCIMQDSMHDKKIQILRMKQVYSAAKCAIAAVSADSAEVGLLGVTPDRVCDSVDALDECIESSPWSTRAWCYQEKVLSHRAILFTSSGVYMQCQNGVYNIEGKPLLGRNDSQSKARFNEFGGMLTVPKGQDMLAYISAVEFYSRRKLTNQKDKMNAFQGIFQRYKGVVDGKSSSFCFGLPIAGFDQTFCWRAPVHDPSLRNEAFPSWSWLGWDNAVSFDRKLFQGPTTKQMIYCEDNYHNDDNEDTLAFRQPAKYHMIEGATFGFPAAGSDMFYNSPTRSLYASLTGLRIASDPVRTEGSNGYYAVFPTRCSETPPTPPPEPRPMTLLDYLTQPLPKPKIMDKKTEAAPSIPAAEQWTEKFDLGEHDSHEACEVKKPLGYIWLNTEWRKKQLEQFVMRFMALAGERNEEKPGQWVITMLMCTQRMAKNGHFWANERVQVMDCSITEESWEKTGAKVTRLTMT